MGPAVDPGDFAKVEESADAEALARYLRDASLLDEVKAMNDQLLSVLDLRKGDRVLDVGCGVGDEVRRLAEIVGAKGHVVGVDTATMVEAARTAGTPQNAEFIVGDAHDLPLPDGSVDRYRAHRVYMHLRDPAAALAEAVRVVRPGGTVVLSEPDWGTLALDSDDRELTAAVIEAIGESMQEPWIGRRLSRLFREAGLVDVQIAPQFGVFPNFKTAHDFLLRDATEKVIRNHVFEADRVAAWLEELATRDAEGTFFFGGAIVLARGHRASARTWRSKTRDAYSRLSRNRSV